MNGFRQSVRRIMHPSIGLLALLCAACALLLILVFRRGLENTALAYVVYPICAYAFAAVVIRCIPLPGRCSRALHRIPAAHRYMTDLRWRAEVSLWNSLAVTAVFCLYKAIMGWQLRSAWLGTLAFYDLTLATARLWLIRSRAKQGGENAVCRACGWFLLLMTAALAAKVNAGEKLTWEELSDATWAVGNTSSSAGYIYPTMWLMENYDKKITDLPNVVQLGYADAFAQAAAEQVDVIVCYADGRRDYEAAWNTATDSADATGKAGMGRTDSIWNELNVIGVTEGIYNDTVAITTANEDVYNPEFINALQTALINIINTEEGKAIFNVYSHTGYAIATDADYDGARTALTVVQ